MDSKHFRDSVIEFVQSSSTSVAGEYVMCSGGQITLYASCFAAMTLHYLDALAEVSKDQGRAWAEHICSWQDPQTGRFLGPEIQPHELTSPEHDWDHVTMHLTAHALPALELLGARPTYSLSFARRFLDLPVLSAWLNDRDWRHAWLEGNNLLFVGQFLLHLRDSEGVDEASSALDLYFDWLDSQQDPGTGLWGTRGYCPPWDAMYGAYHQLLVYHYCERRVRHCRRIIDTTLGLQHADGSFTRGGGGGACEDADGVDILVNLYQRTGYRPRAVRRALERALENVLSQMMPNGGFVYRRGAPFSQMGVARTSVPPDTADIFSTWFRVHTVGLACQVLREHPLADIPWRFNETCSMGWHRSVNFGDAKQLPWHDRARAAFRHHRLRAGRVFRTPSLRS